MFTTILHQMLTIIHLLCFIGTLVLNEIRAVIFDSRIKTSPCFAFLLYIKRFGLY